MHLNIRYGFDFINISHRVMCSCFFRRENVRNPTSLKTRPARTISLLRRGATLIVRICVTAARTYNGAIMFNINKNIWQLALNLRELLWTTFCFLLSSFSCLLGCVHERARFIRIFINLWNALIVSCCHLGICLLTKV